MFPEYSHARIASALAGTSNDLCKRTYDLVDLIHLVVQYLQNTSIESNEATHLKIPGKVKS